MVKKFIRFNTTWEYIKGQKTAVYAEDKLNTWLEEHPEYEVCDWKVVCIPTDMPLFCAIYSIFVCYQCKETLDK